MGSLQVVALLNVLVKRPPEQVWAVLADGSSYADWVIGTREIRSVDAGWPRVGTSICYSFGVGPWTLDDRTTVRNADEPRMLELEVVAGRIGTARLHFEIRPWGDGRTVIVLDEHPLSGPGAHVHNMAVDLVLRLRNRRMLDKLARLIERRHPAPTTDG